MSYADAMTASNPPTTSPSPPAPAAPAPIRRTRGAPPRSAISPPAGPPGASMGVGARIRAARQVAGITQAELALAVGVSRSAVAQWETERAGQVGVNLAKVSEILRVSSEHLLRGIFPTEGGASAEDAGELALLRLFRVCQGEDRQFLLRMAARFARQADRVLAGSVRGVDSLSAL